MSRKPKPKRKRGQTIDSITFYSPLTVKECIEHLKSGRSPLKNYRLKVEHDRETFQLWWARYYPALTHIRADKWRTTRRWSSPVWIEGTLTPTDTGLTRVQAEVMREFGASPRGQAIWLALMVVLLGTVAATITATRWYSEYNQTPSLTWRLLAVIITVMIITGFIQRRRVLNLYRRELLRYLTGRLDVQR